MRSAFYRRLDHLDHLEGRQALRAGLMGLEKESLRVTSDGLISQRPHPRALGAALTHPQITTDYSEALLEFITPPRNSIAETLQILDDIFRFVYPRLEDEILWATSMPCVLEGEAKIPIACYGESNIGKLKHIYRRGLGHRYGKTMQVISGVHFNYSFSQDFWQLLAEAEKQPAADQAFISEAYVGLTRNFLRYAWLVPYLFGSSPAVCKSFFAGKQTRLQDWSTCTAYAPYACSLRISDVGYQNRENCDPSLAVKYDSLQTYVDSLTRLTQTPHPDYQQLGIQRDGEYQQINGNWLQIENEYYSAVRLKQVCGRYEKPAHALRDRGVQYIELRALDVNVFSPVGVAAEQLQFLELLALYCLLQASPLISDHEHCALDRNMKAVALNGRDPALRLERGGELVKLSVWAEELCNDMMSIAEVLDADADTSSYQQAVQAQLDKIAEPELTPAAQVLAEMRANQEDFFEFGMRKSQQYRAQFKQAPLSADKTAEFMAMAAESLQEQQQLEAESTQPFAQFLADYLAG